MELWKFAEAQTSRRSRTSRRFQAERRTLASIAVKGNREQHARPAQVQLSTHNAQDTWRSARAGMEAKLHGPIPLSFARVSALGFLVLWVCGGIRGGLPQLLHGVAPSPPPLHVRGLVPLTQLARAGVPLCASAQHALHTAGAGSWIQPQLAPWQQAWEAGGGRSSRLGCRACLVSRIQANVISRGVMSRQDTCHSRPTAHWRACL